MDGEEKFWISIWALAATVVIVLILSVMACNIVDTRAIKSLIAKGVPPIAARCAVNGTNDQAGKTAICLTVAQQEAEK